MTVVLVPGVPALLPAYSSIEDPVADLRAACLDAVGRLGPRVRVVAPAGTGAQVAQHLLDVLGAEPDAAATDVLVVGNGSAKRTEKAPGHLDERAEVFDDDLRRALLEPLPAALAAVDEQLAEELWADVAGFGALAGLLAPGTVADLLYDDAPFGVQYWVIAWA